jgi:hypothetical protein
MDTYSTLTEAINGLRSKGYTLDFNLKPECVECKSLDIHIHPDDFMIDEFYRFEGASNPDDNSIVFAVSSKTGLKGVLVDAYGMYSDSLTDEMVQKLQMRHQ